ncbi:MAG: AraC family transcriptional regulator of adaptative response / DNA-3-methyladenine glycosylase II [Candidatus Azotimanducaceae bacterium]|jgi:AraC family transcriptional regulator of adaptative response / DNA-3-methyladenine glycosylase II
MTTTQLHFTHAQFEQARQARDIRFDGRFFVGVTTTGIYCRPICPVKLPLARNVTFYQTAAGAAEAGFRPCLRCRPESSPGTPAWMGTSATVKRALRLISEGALDESSIDDLSDRLGVTSRHLARLFAKHLGASPISVAQTRRLHFAKKLLDETALKMTDIALSSGYSSVRRFNDHIKQVYDRTPSELRRRAVSPTELGAFSLKLGCRQPFDFKSVLSFLAVRAIPGVESVVDSTYSRTIELDGYVARLSVREHPAEAALLVSVEAEDPRHLFQIINRVKNLFDVDADPAEVNGVLSRDRGLAALIQQHPGQRLPGCWSPFEIAVRAIVGQQVSVKGATTVMGRIAARYGDQSAQGLCFPKAEALALLDPTTLSMPQRRAQAIKDMSAEVASGALRFDSDVVTESLVEQLTAIKGIGPWTAQYISMRALNDPDAFLDGDLVLLKVAKDYLGIGSRAELLDRAEQWRPWRAYAGMHLWRAAAQGMSSK